MEWVKPPATLTGKVDVHETPPVAVLSLPAQVADKVCALYELHGEGGEHSSRARDLADIAMIAAQREIDGTALSDHLAREEARRRKAGTLQGPLPAELRLADAQIRDWRGRWKKATRNAPIEFDDALAVAAAFIDPALAHAVAELRWSPAERRWA